MSTNMPSNSSDDLIRRPSVETVLVESSEESSDSDAAENFNEKVPTYALIKSEIMENRTTPRLKSDENRSSANMEFIPLEQTHTTFTNIVGAINEDNKLSMEHVNSNNYTDNNPYVEARLQYNSPIIAVGNLPEVVNENHVEVFFSRYGHIAKISYHNNHFQVQYMNHEDAIKALEVNGMKYKGSRIEVALLDTALPKFNKGIVIPDLPEGIGKDLLWETCEIFGPVKNIYFSRNFAYIIFENSDSVELALAKGHVTTFIGHYLKLEQCNHQIMSTLLPAHTNLSLQPPTKIRLMKDVLHQPQPSKSRKKKRHQKVQSKNLKKFRGTKFLSQ